MTLLHQLWHLHDSLPPSSAFIYRPDDPDLPLKALLAMLAEHHRPPWATGLSARKTVRRLHHNSSDPNKLQGLCLSIAQELVSKRVTDIQSLNPDKVCWIYAHSDKHSWSDGHSGTVPHPHTNRHSGNHSPEAYFY